MVSRFARLMPKVPRFVSLRDFILAKKWYYRALFMPVEDQERSDLELRLRRHHHRLTSTSKLS